MLKQLTILNLLTGPYFAYTLRESQITLKCNPSQPGNGTIPEFTGTMPSANTTLYVNMLFHTLFVHLFDYKFIFYLLFYFFNDEREYPVGTCT